MNAPSPVAVRCACGRSHTAEGLLLLDQRGAQEVGDGTFLRMANCGCGSTISVPWCGLDGCVCGDVLNHGVADAGAK